MGSFLHTNSIENVLFLCWNWSFCFSIGVKPSGVQIEGLFFWNGTCILLLQFNLMVCFPSVVRDFGFLTKICCANFLLRNQNHSWWILKKGRRKRGIRGPCGGIFTSPQGGSKPTTENGGSSGQKVQIYNETFYMIWDDRRLSWYGPKSWHLRTKKDVSFYFDIFDYRGFCEAKSSIFRDLQNKRNICFLVLKCHDLGPYQESRRSSQII